MAATLGNNLSTLEGGNSCSKREKISCWSSAAEEIGGNLDLLIQILFFLPARSIVRFMAVCTQWRYLILGTRFPLMHVNHNPTPSISGLYFFSDKYPIPLQHHSLPSLAFTGKPHQLYEFKIHDSRHGLMLCSYYLSPKTPQIIVCNPTTQKHKVFHQTALILNERLTFAHFYLDFDPSVSEVYRLILIRNSNLLYEVNVCASNQLTWKTNLVRAQPTWGDLLIHGLLSSNGVIYIMTEKGYLVKFNIRTKKLSAANATYEPEIRHFQNIGYFGEHADGNLILVVSPKTGLRFGIYEMDKLEGTKWVLKHRINFRDELCNFPESQGLILKKHFALLRIFWDGENEEKDLTLVFGVPGKVISYNHNRKVARVICDLPNWSCFNWEYTYYNVHPFIGSLCKV